MGNYNVRNENPPSAAVIQARARRLQRADAAVVRTESFISEVLNVVNTSVKDRVRIATEYAKSKVILNISRPVTKTYLTKIVTGPNGKPKTVSEVHISDRSVDGEFPKADTTQLMKTIIGVSGEIGPGQFAGYIGTPLDYGVILELKMNRSFLLRTLHEETATITRIISGPIQ